MPASQRSSQHSFLDCVEISISSSSDSSESSIVPKKKQCVADSVESVQTLSSRSRPRRAASRSTGATFVGEEISIESSASSTESNSTKPVIRRRRIAYSSSSEETVARENGGGLSKASSGTDEEVKLRSRQRRNLRSRVRRPRRKSSSTFNSSSSSLNSTTSEEEESKLRTRKVDKKKVLESPKQSNDSNEGAEGSVDGDERDGKKGRKKIRKILKDKKLSSETKTAEALERERRKRLEERQKLYNSVLEGSVEKSASKNTRLVLDFKKDSDEALVEVHPDLVKHLKPHQIQAVRFLYDNIIESVDEHRKNHGRLSGAILAHCMGLGKSLSTIAFIHTLLTCKEEDLGIKTCLVVCPVNTLLNWHREWRHWMPEDAEINLFELATAAANNFRVDVIRRWHSEGGVLLIGYDMYRNLTTSLLKKTRKQVFKKLIPAALIDPGPDIVVCDEGHLLKNCKTGVTKAINSLKTPKRIILTGTPLQNNLTEYWTMVNFVKPNLLGSAREFANRFVNPIKNGQHSNSTQRDVQLMKKRAHVLFKTLDGCVQRRDYSCLTQYLPPRLEYVLKIRLSDVQCELYRAFLQQRKERNVSASGDDQRNTLFRDQQTLYRVWTHPYTLRMHETREAKRLLLRESSSEEDEEKEMEVDDGEDGGSLTSVPRSDSELNDSADSKSASSSDSDVKTKVSTNSSRLTRASFRQMRKDSGVIDLLSDNEGINRDPLTPKKTPVGEDGQLNGNVDNGNENDGNKPWWYSLYQDEYDLRIDVGAKLSALFFIIKKCTEIGDKVLIFSQSLFSLDLIEWFLAAIDRQWCMSQGIEMDSSSKQAQEFEKLLQSETFKMPSLVEYFSDMDRNTWRRGKDYERIDGSLSAVQRNSLQTRFNSPSQRFRLLIISTKAGGLGVNLTAANRLVIFDVSWNPSHDLQSIFRSYRFGQTKPVYIYRMVAQGTMEEKMYDRQVTKQSLALRVVDEQQVDRHFKEEDLRELYTFEPDIQDAESANRKPPPALPKDRLLADLLSERPNLLVSYHDHDSLLENRLDEGLSEAERAEAWREYEEEKRVGRPMTEYQRLLLNNPEAAAALMVQRQQMEEEQRRRMAAMASAYAAATSNNRLLYSSVNPTPLEQVDSRYVTLPAHSLPALQPESSPFAPRGPPSAGLERRDVFSESFNAMRNMLLARYPMLAHSPGALHDMTLRLFVNSVAGQMGAQNSIPLLTPAAPTDSSSMPSSSATNITSNPSDPVGSSLTNDSVVDVDDESTENP
uniref:PHD-type domain-containing protein n=1 Tax=Mesocestoides corti TaxID=53468 RepID=A0A5K3F2A4_MESCO